MSLASLESLLTSRLPTYLDALARMVSINSFTPNAAGVDAVGALTAEVFAALGFTSEFVPSANAAFGKHLFLSRRGSSSHHIAFVSHHDTVFPREEELANDFRWRDEGDRVIGPGVADIKGGTVVAFMVLDALAALAPAVFEHFTWLVAVDACEEQMADDFAAHCRSRLPAPNTAAILVMECGADVGRDRLVVARKGMANFRVAVAGKAAHSGTGFWGGKNAIVAASKLIPSLAALADYDRDLTVNVGTVRGGTVTNRVPHECLIEGELRAFDPGVLRETMEVLRGLIDAETMRLTFTSELSPWPVNEGSNALLAAYQRVGQEMGTAIIAEHRGGLSDGNLLWAHAPTIDGLGPVGGSCHCSQRAADGRGQEYAVKASFVRKAALTARMLASRMEAGA